MHQFISFLFLCSLLTSAIFLSHSECKTAHHTPRSQKSVSFVFCNNHPFSFASETTLTTGIFTASVIYKLHYRYFIPSEFLSLLHHPYQEFSSSTKFHRLSFEIHRNAMQPAATIPSQVLRKHPQLIQNTSQRPSWADAMSDDDDIFSPKLSDNSAEQNPIPASPTQRKHSETTNVQEGKSEPLEDSSAMDTDGANLPAISTDGANLTDISTFSYRRLEQWIHLLHRNPSNLPSREDTHGLNGVTLTEEQYVQLEEYRTLPQTSVANQYYENWLKTIATDAIITQDHVHVFCLYASILLAERKKWVTKMYNFEAQHILDMEDAVTGDATFADNTRQYYRDKAKASNNIYGIYYRSMLPSLPDVFKEVALVEWRGDMTNPTCELGELVLTVANDSDVHAHVAKIQPVPQSKFHDHPKKNRSARRKTRTELKTPPEAMSNIHFGPGHIPSAAMLVVHSDLVEATRGDPTVPRSFHEARIDSATDIDRLTFPAQYLVITKYNPARTLDETIQDLKATISTIGAHSAEALARGFTNTLHVDEQFIRDNFDNQGWQVNHNRELLHELGCHQNVIVKLETPALFGTQYAENHQDQQIYPVTALVASALFPSKSYLVYALRGSTNTRKLQTPTLWRSIGSLRCFPYRMDKNTTLNVLYFNILQLLDARFQQSDQHAVLLYNIYHEVGEEYSEGRMNYFPAGTKDTRPSTKAEIIMEVIYLGAECNTDVSLDTPAFKQEWFNCFGGIREGSDTDTIKWGLNLHGVTLELFNSVREAMTNRGRLASLAAPQVLILDNVPTYMLSRDGLRLLMTDEHNARVISDGLSIAYTLPGVPNTRADSWRLVMHWHDTIPRIDFDPIRQHYNLNQVPARIATVAGLEEILRLKTMHENHPAASTSRVPTTSRRTYAAAAATTSTSGSGNEVERAGTTSEELVMRRVTQQVALAIQTMTQTVDKTVADLMSLQQAVHNQDTKVGALQEEIATQNRKVEYINSNTEQLLRIAMKNDLRDLFGEYERLIDMRGRLLESKAIAAHENRMQRKMDEIVRQAEQAGIDIRDRLSDFTHRQA
jgi:hypothetical protein